MIEKFVSRSNVVRILGGVKTYLDKKIQELSGDVNDMSQSISDLDNRMKELEIKGFLTKEQAERLIALLEGMFDSDDDNNVKDEVFGHDSDSDSESDCL